MVFFDGLPLIADLVTRLERNGGRSCSLAGVEASLALCLSPTLKLLGVAVEGALGLEADAVLGVTVEALGGRPRLLGVTLEAKSAVVCLALFKLGGSGGGIVVVMARLGLAAAAVVSKILPRGVVIVEGTSRSGDGARASFLSLLGGMRQCCTVAMLNLVIEERIVELLFRCKYWGTRLAPSGCRVTSLYAYEVKQRAFPI